MPFLLYAGTTPFADGNNNRYTPDLKGWVSVPDFSAVQPLIECGAISVPAVAIPISTGNRPTSNLLVGMNLFDTTLNKPIWLKNLTPTWVDSTGATV